jgi:hypothetical protein
MTFHRIASYTDVTIPSGSSISSDADLGRSSLQGIIMPASWDAASLKFMMTDNKNTGTYVDVYFDCNMYVEDAGTSRYVAVNPAPFAGIEHVKIVSWDSTSNSEVNQTADRILTLVTRPI